MFNLRKITTLCTLLLFVFLLSCSTGDSTEVPTLAPTAVAPPSPTAATEPDPTDAPAQSDEDLWTRAQRAGKLVVGTSPDYPPFEYYTDEFQLDGFDIALLTEIANRLNLQIEFRDMAFDGLGGALQLGQIDLAISAISATPERDAVVDFSNTYFVSEDALVAAASSGITAVNSVEEMVAYRVGVQAGSVFEDWLQELIAAGTMPEANLYVYSELDAGGDDLVAGRVDLFLLDLAPAELAAENFDALVLVGQGLNRQRFSIALPQGEAVMQDQLNQAIVAMQTDGLIARFANMYLGLEEDEIPPLPEPTPPEPEEPQVPEGCINGMAYIADLTFDDKGMTDVPQFAPGQPFEKGWRVQNVGTCVWDLSYALTFVTGNVPAARMSGRPVAPDFAIQPGGTFDFYADLVAPLYPGVYQGFWTMRDGDGNLFGDRVWAAAEVIGNQTPTPAPTQTAVPGISFVANPTQLTAGQCTTFNWDATNAQSAYLYPLGSDWTNREVPLSGNMRECPARTTTYEFRVLNNNNSFELRQITIYVQPNGDAPTINLFVTEPDGQLNAGSCLTIRWSVSGAVDRVTISRDDTVLWDNAPIGGATQDCPPGTGNKVYAIEATGSGGTNRTQTHVNVVQPQATAVPTNAPPPQATATPLPPTINQFAVTPENVSVGACVTVSWSVGAGTNQIRLLRNGNILYEGAPIGASLPDCLNEAGSMVYRLEAIGGTGQNVAEERRVTVR